mgnify:CR=1 FL=1
MSNGLPYLQQQHAQPSAAPSPAHCSAKTNPTTGSLLTLCAGCLVTQADCLCACHHAVDGWLVAVLAAESELLHLTLHSVPLILQANRAPCDSVEQGMCALCVTRSIAVSSCT